MKSLLLLIVLPAVVAMTSCDRIRNLATNKEATAVAANGGKVQPLTADDYSEFVAQEGPLVVVDFYADWCGPCKMLSPLVEKMAGEFSGVAIVGKLNVDEAKEVAASAGVTSIPDVRFFRNGKLVHQFMGYVPEAELRAKFEAHAPAAVATASAPEEGSAAAAAEPTVPQQPIQPMSKDWLPPGVERR